MKFDKYFLLTWRRVLWIAVIWITAVILHNLVYALFYSYFKGANGDEPVFFIIATIIVPGYFLVSLIYTIIRKIFFI